MAKLVYIRQIKANTFLHFTTRGEAFCLRDYSYATDVTPRPVLRQGDGHTVQTIRALASQPGNHIIDAPDQPLEEFSFWHKQIVSANQRYLSADGNADSPATSSSEGPNANLPRDEGAATKPEEFRQPAEGTVVCADGRITLAGVASGSAEVAQESSSVEHYTSEENYHPGLVAWLLGGTRRVEIAEGQRSQKATKSNSRQWVIGGGVVIAAAIGVVGWFSVSYLLDKKSDEKKANGVPKDDDRKKKSELNSSSPRA